MDLFKSPRRFRDARQWQNPLLLFNNHQGGCDSIASWSTPYRISTMTMMNNYQTGNTNQKWLLLLTIALLMMVKPLTAQDRDGSIDLTGSTGRAIYLNHNGSGSGLGVEDSPFTVESWVYLTSDDRFTFFRFRNGDARVSLHYEGDDDKSNGPWNIELKGAGYGETDWRLDYASGKTGPDFTNNWHHVAFTYDGTSSVKLYIDGEEMFSYGLVTDGSRISHLYPVDGDGDNDCFIGRESVLAEARGTMYVSEVRLWKTRLTSSEISTYYNEEVNSSHPEWNNLIRYYHGNESSGSGGSTTFPDRSTNGTNYTAGVTNSDVSVSLSYTPSIKPPSFDNSSVSASIDAYTCESDDGITVNWTSFRTLDSYGGSVTPTYYVTQSRDNALVYSGTNSVTEDYDVSPGDAETYNLKTFWYIDGVAVYTDDELISNTGSMVSEFDAPTGFEVSNDNCDVTIDLSWDAMSPSPPNWTVQRATDLAFTSGVVTLSSTIAGSVTSFSDTSPNPEQSYYYRVRASGDDDNGCAVEATNSVVVTGFTSEAPAAPTGLTVVVDDDNNELDISWTNPSNSYADGFILRREREDGSDAVDIVIDNTTTTSYSDSDIAICQTYRYKIAATNECSPDGVFSNTTQTGLLGLDIDDVISDVNASKGYFGSEVLIEWEINGSLSQVDRFRIERTVAGSDLYQLIGVIDNNLFFTDESASAGVFYNYRVTGETTCEDQIVYTNEIVDLGFRQPFGIANGHIEYSGGNAVEDVVINFERTDGSQTGGSLRFDGDGDYVAIDSLFYEGSDYEELTLETWFKTSATAPAILASSEVNDYWRLYHASGKVGFNLQNRIGVVSSSTINDGEWHHVAVVFDQGTLTLYVDGEKEAEEETAISTFGSGNKRYLMLGVGSEANEFNGNIRSLDFFEGNLDEFRIWSVSRDSLEIKDNYNRLISNEQNGLVLYYRFDEGTGDYVYDASKTGDNFNQHDGTFVGGVSFSDEIPDSDQLGIRAVTDQFGDYSADYIPYNGSGDVFRVTPAFGQHVFTPSSKSIFLGDGSAVQNNVDFEDISFFTVTGKVTYKDTNVPVENATVLIDGEVALGADNSVVRTDVEGDYEINVPIGNHYLSVEKDGHTFYEGYFPPLDDQGSVAFHEFTEDLTVNFTDSTKVKVAGRLVGGTREAEKMLGFGLSTNNVGTATLTFDLQNAAYGLPTATVDTDPYSGEYEIEMIPEQFVISDIITSAGYSIDAEDLSALDLRSSLDEITVVEDEEDEESASYSYHHQLNFVIRETPQILVYNEDDEAFTGDDVFTYTDQETGEQLEIDISGLGFPYPVFDMGSRYEANVYVVETYSNAGHPNGAIIDNVPVEGADITIIDNLAIDPTDGNTGKTDADGYFAYDFTAGIPSISTDNNGTSFTKTFEVSATVDGIGVDWNNGDVFRAYLLGTKPQEGTGFVTYGPDQVDFVLRDPPGSNSYAYLEKGSSYSTTEGWGLSSDSNTGLDRFVSTGLDIQVGGGTLGPVAKTDQVNVGQLGMTLTRSYDYSGNYTETYTFNERIETSSDPEDVGSMADLYVGKATNVYVSKTNNIRLVDRDYAIANLPVEDYLDFGADMVIAKLEGFAIDNNGTPTYFIYSQKFIIEDLIPELLTLRDDLLRNRPGKYESHLDYSSRYYGLNNDHNGLIEAADEVMATYPTATLENLSYTFTPTEEEEDSVAFINDQITTWVNQIGLNEAEKAEAELLTNLSIDGSAGAYTSEVTQSYNSNFNYASSRTMKFRWNAAIGTYQNGIGTEYVSTFDGGSSVEQRETEEINHEITFGYVIDERDEGDYYSIDVKTVDGVGLYNRNNFADRIPNFNEFASENAVELGVTGGFLLKTSVTGSVAIYNAVNKYILKNSSKLNGFTAQVGFAIDAVLFLAETADFTYETIQTYQKQDGVDEDYNVSAFKISSPIFSVKGGATRCPYEPGELSFEYSEDGNNPYDLHTATLLRENPTISVETAIQNNVPEDEAAVFTLNMGNESETETNIWYELSIDETTNPDGAIILIDELTAERQYLVEANSTLQKTLTIEKGASGVLDYDSIGLILHSVCQFDPEVSQVEIADTVYVSAHFLPECSDVAVGNFNENWIINYDDGEEINVSLDDYNINLTTLEKIDFQYKTLSGTPLTAMTFYKDASTDGYTEYDGPKDVIDGAADVSFIWDVSALNDGTYQIRARAHCSDGSVFESDYLTGTIDTSTPVAFGTPAPEDGVLESGDDIKIRFSEEIEAGFVKDFNIELRSVLNGADVSHATSVQFDGVDDEVSIDNITFNNKSFTIEYWLKNDVEVTATETQVLTYSNGNNLVEISQLGTDINFKLGANTLVADPTGFYTVVTPWDSWHHWAFVYDAAQEEVKIYMDDQIVLLEDEVTYNPSFQGLLSLGNSQLAGKMHEFRIWEDVRSYGEVVSNMSITLTGNEPGLYGYWMMDEGTGDQALDEASGRHATVNAGWSLDPGGYSWEFDGSNYLTINSTNILADQETDFTIEFWFKGNATGTTQTLISNGLGDGTDGTTDPNSVIVIEAQADGTIHALSNGYDFQGTDTGFMDGDWHHLALVVDRTTNARMYIDGAQQNQTDADNLSQFYGAELTIGARINQLDPATADYDNYLQGAVDEMRFWNTARPAELIEEYMHTKIERDEPGLISYHPFETYEVLLGAYIMESTLVDQVVNDDLGDVSDGYSSDGMDHYSDQKPAVRDVRGMQDIPFDFAVNDDEIVIIPTVDADRIEGQVMEITILSVQDLNGNTLHSPVTWTAYVQQNEIKWDASDISTTKPVEDDLTIIASFTNASGAAYSYELENVPAWLTPDHMSGVINPLETIEVQLAVSEALNIGSYNHTLSLSTDMGFDDQLAIDLRVFGDEPLWAVDDSEYEYSMSVFGRLILDGEISTDEYDMVAAFVGDEIRGVVSPTYVAGVDEYQVFLNIYSNTVSNEDIDLKIYDASTGRIHENVTPDMAFVANDIKGTILDPVEIEADDRISMEIGLREGWTWVSFNLDDANLSSIDATLAGIGAEGDLVKNQSAFDEYSADLWFGTLTAAGGFTQGDMYKIKLAEAATLKIIGSPTDVYTTPINISQNWNHLGFIPQEQMTLEEALVSMNPSDGDVIKTANRFAMYAGASLGWVGSLRSMAPGDGYMLYANNTGTLTYPERASLSNSRLLDEDSYADLFAVAQNEHGHTMSIIANVEGLDLLDNRDDQLLVAYVDDQVRGYVPVSEVGQSDLYFLSVAAEETDDISFKLYDALNASYIDLSGGVSYAADKVVGTLDEPVALGVSGALGVNEILDIQAYPNPFDQYLDLRIPMTEASANVTLLDLSGKIIFAREVINDGGTYLQLRFNEEVGKLKSGVYLLQITQGQEQKIIKLRK